MKKIIGYIALCLCLGYGQAGFAEKFSADMITTSNGQKITGKYYISGSNFRTDSNVQGMKTSTIVQQDKNMVYALMHNQKMFIQMPIKKANPSSLMASHTRYKPTMQFIQNDKVNGIPAKKYKAMSPESKEIVYIWMTQDDKWPVKIEEPKSGSVIEYKNINANFSESVFAIPADYKTFAIPNFGSFMQK